MLALLLIVPAITFAQVKLGIETGPYWANNNTNIQQGSNVSVEVSHLLKEHLIVTTQANYGKNDYFETNTNLPYGTIADDYTNARLSTIHVALLAGYHQRFTNWFSASIQTGVSSYTEIRDYPYQIDDRSIFMIENSYTDIAFPFKASLAFQAFKDFELAFVAGCYLMPGSPVLGVHFGPQISLSF